MPKPPLPTREIGGRQVRFTHHAIDRILDMAVEDKEVIAALTRPKYVRPAPKDPTVTCMQKSRIVLFTATDDKGVLVVITVMWSNASLWGQDFDVAEYPPESGRVSRKPATC